MTYVAINIEYLIELHLLSIYRLRQNRRAAQEEKDKRGYRTGRHHA